jgi:hypothetical protein
LSSVPGYLGGLWHGRSRAYNPPGGWPELTPLSIDGGTLQHVTKKLALNVSGGLTHVEVTHDHPAARVVYTVAIPGAPAGRRVLTMDSFQFSTGHASTLLPNEWASVASRELRAWSIGVLRLDTNLTGGFETADHAHVLLAGRERPDYFFLRNGSELVANGVRPYFGVMGGTVRYSRGKWVVDSRPADIGTTIDGRVRPLTVRNAATTNAVRLVDLDRSVTFRDTQYIDIGAGYTSTTMPLS